MYWEICWKEKVKDQIEEEEPETSNLADESNKSKKHPVDVLINEVDIITNEGHNDVDKSKTNRRKKHHDDISSTTDNVFNRELSITPKRNKISKENKSHSSANLKRSARLLRNRTQKDNVTSTSHNFIMPDNGENSTNIEIDNNPIPDKFISNSNITNTNYTSDGMSQDDMNHFTVKIATEHTEDTTDFVSHISVPRENSISLEENKRVDKSLDKDSGRSTMLRTTTYNDSNLPTSKRLTGRIHKKYKKRDNVSNKISKVLSRSIYNSGEYEILNGNEPNMVDSGSVVQTSLTQPIDKYVEKESNFKLVNDLMVTDILKNSKDVRAMGYLKLPPGSQKPLHIARKFALFYFVIEGEAFIQVHNKASKIGKYSHFMIPLGIEYSINNLSKEDSLTLGFVRMPPICES
ncbi:hypothetical protein NQ314_006761 [Rhamnusium bicolor]|uniref:Mif2/CENP-C cupin domain-containing protein n=1 Tax=Rhamnusium bicolor TaxID=1586634 RepID=A0AAV8YZK3_9CUCU|nr:hypothetical protein NQ314_006761 [Rhamnusium bicolor]